MANPSPSARGPLIYRGYGTIVRDDRRRELQERIAKTEASLLQYKDQLAELEKGYRDADEQ